MGENWIEVAEKLKFEEGVSWTNLPGELKKRLGVDVNPAKIRTTLRRRPAYSLRKGDASVAADLSDLNDRLLVDLQKRRTMDYLTKAYRVSPRVITAVIEDLKEQGFNVEQVGGELFISRYGLPQEKKFEVDWRGDKIIRFGLAGDMQYSSKFVQHTYLNEFYDLCLREGYLDVYNPGDVDDGQKMHPGHEYELYAHGVDEHIGGIIKHYPSRQGITTHFITGNHDWSFMKDAGMDIGKRIAAERPDMHYLGYGAASIKLTPNCILELRHPTDGTAYAISYKIQKMIDAMSGGEKPNILAVGHYHKMEMIFYRNVFTFQTGCFQAQTDFMRGRQIAAALGGWLVEIHVDDDGTIRRCKGEFIPIFNPIKDDWKKLI